MSIVGARKKLEEASKHYAFIAGRYESGVDRTKHKLHRASHRLDQAALELAKAFGYVSPNQEREKYRRIQWNAPFLP